MLFAHGVVVPEMAAGVVVLVTAVIDLQVKFVPHALPAYTQIFPEAPLGPKLRVTDDVPCPETNEAPVGIDQV